MKFWFGINLDRYYRKYKANVFGVHSIFLCLEHAKVLFETDTLEAVSPALISRSTILYFHDDQVVDWKCVFDAWKTTAHNKFSLDVDEYVYLFYDCLR